MLRHPNIVSYYHSWREDVKFSARIAQSSQKESDIIDTDTDTDTDTDRDTDTDTDRDTDTDADRDTDTDSNIRQISYNEYKFIDFLQNCAKSNQWPGKSSDDYQISSYNGKVSKLYIFKKS